MNPERKENKSFSLEAGKTSLLAMEESRSKKDTKGEEKVKIQR